jgi:hypothetical protein
VPTGYVLEDRYKARKKNHKDEILQLVNSAKYDDPLPGLGEPPSTCGGSLGNRGVFFVDAMWIVSRQFYTSFTIQGINLLQGPRFLPVSFTSSEEKARHRGWWISSQSWGAQGGNFLIWQSLFQKVSNSFLKL